MLAEVEIEALDKGRRHFPAPLGQSLLDCLKRAADDAVFHPHEASAPIGFDHLHVEQSGQWHPTRLGPGAWGLAALGLNPLAVMGQQRRALFSKAVRQE